MKTKWHALKKVKFIVALGFLIASTTLYYACGENRLPPPSPPPSGTITVTGDAV